MFALVSLAEALDRRWIVSGCAVIQDLPELGFRYGPKMTPSVSSIRLAVIQSLMQVANRATCLRVHIGEHLIAGAKKRSRGKIAPARLCGLAGVSSTAGGELRLTYNRTEMANRDRVAEILEIKRRGQRRAVVHYDLRNLTERWNEFPQKNLETAAFFPIRAVTLMEVFTRAWIATFVDFGKPYVERAIAFAKNVKLDYELIQALGAP
jgi:hypothetical protein